MWNLQAIMPNNLKRNNIKRIKQERRRIVCTVDWVDG